MSERHTINGAEALLERRNRELAAIGLLLAPSHLHQRREAVDALLRAVLDGLGFERAGYFEIDAETGDVRGVAGLTRGGARIDISGVALPAPKPDEALGRIVSSRKPRLMARGEGGNALLAAMGADEGIIAPVALQAEARGDAGAHGGGAEAPAAGILVVDYGGHARALPEDAESLWAVVEKAAVVFDNAALYEHVQKFKEMADTDALTQLYNRRAFFRLLQVEIHRAQRYKLPLSIVMIDIDRFKAFNDTYGHHAGDKLLTSFAQLLVKTSRNIDVTGRLGGEEFAVVLPETGHEQAGVYAERIRGVAEEFGGTLAEHYNGCQFTISVGITSFNESDDIDSFFNRADKAMYAAKQRGRNRVCTL